MSLREQDKSGRFAFRRKDGEPFSNIGELAAESILRRDPIYIIKANQLGDDMIIQWASHYMLKKLSEEAGLKNGKINLRTYVPGESPKDSLVLLDDRKYNRSSQETSENVYHFMLFTLARTLNLPLSREDFENIPQPIRTDHAPLDAFDKEKVIKEGMALREKILRDYKSIVVIAQGGSIPEKRYSDKQVADLVKAAKDASRDSFVAVVSDRDLVKFKSEKLWKRVIFSRDNGKQPKFIEEADIMVSGRDINEFCKWFLAADTLVTTDTFFAWLGAGSKAMRSDRRGKLQKNDVLILYTLADPQVFGITGAEIMTSKAILNERTLMKITGETILDTTDYYAEQNKGGEINLDRIQRGISQEDFALARQKLLDVLLHNTLKVGRLGNYQV